MKLSTHVLPVLLAVALAPQGCEEADAVSIRLRLNEDFSGTLTTSTLERPVRVSPLEQNSAGLTWGDHVNLVCSAGAFDAVGEIRLDEIKFESRIQDDGLNYLKITLPRGPKMSWPRSLVPDNIGNEEQRKALARTIDPSGRIRDIGSLIKFEIQLPSGVVAHGVNTRARRLKENASKNTASLVVPMDLALTTGRDIVWHLTWES